MNIKSRTIYASLAAISMLIFTLAWEGWWYIFYLVIGYSCHLLTCIQIFIQFKTIKPTDYFKGKIRHGLMINPIYTHFDSIFNIEFDTNVNFSRIMLD